MNDNLKKALDNIYDEESAQYLIGEFAEFSPKFERNVERIIVAKSGKKHDNAVRKRGSVIVKAMLASAAVTAALGISLSAAAAATDGFTSGFTKVAGYDDWREQPTVEFYAASLERAPDTIEQTYAPAELKDGINYRTSVYMNNDRSRYALGYMQETEDAVNEPFFTINTMQFVQETKSRFRDTFYTPKYVDVKEITVGGCQGFLVSQERYSGTLNIIIWDNGDYIFRLRCVLPEADALALAESVVPCDEVSGEVLS